MPKPSSTPFECELGSSDSDDESVTLSDFDDNSEHEGEECPTPTTTRTVFRWHSDKTLVPEHMNFTLDDMHVGTPHANVDKFLDQNGYARIKDESGGIHRGIRSNSGTVYIIRDHDEEIIVQLLAHTKQAKTKHFRQVATIKFAEMSKTYYKDNDVSKLDPTMCQLFGGGEPAVLLTTNHITKILAQKAKRKRATVESGSADNSKRRAAQGGGLAPAQLTHSIAHSGLSPEQQEVLAFLTRVCMPMIKAVKADMPNASAPETC